MGAALGVFCKYSERVPMFFPASRIDDGNEDHIAAALGVMAGHFAGADGGSGAYSSMVSGSSKRFPLFLCLTRGIQITISHMGSGAYPLRERRCSDHWFGTGPHPSNPSLTEQRLAKRYEETAYSCGKPRQPFRLFGAFGLCQVT